MERKNELLIRAYLVMFLFIAFAAVIFFRVAKISIQEGGKWRAKGGKNVKMIPLKADRGNIYADDGSVLVMSLPFFDIKMDLANPKQEVFEKGVDSLSILLSRHIDSSKSPYEWRSSLVTARVEQKPGYRYFPIAKDVSYSNLVKLKAFPIFRKGANRGGLIVEKKTRREKPFKSLASRTLGEVRPNAPDFGLESYFDEQLSGPTDSLLMKRMSRDNWIPVLDVSELITKKGHDIVTTLDVDIQDVAQQELRFALEKNRAKGGTVLVMEVKTGAIKAVANLKYSEKSQDYLESYNHGVGTLSEPGSTFKAAAALAMLDDGYINLDTKVDLQGGKKKFYRSWMYDSHLHGIRETDFRETFAISSNVGIATLAMKYYEAADNGRIHFRKKMAQFLLDRKTGIELKGEGKPMFKNPTRKSDGWSGTTVPWMAHGYEVNVTPLQTLAFYNAIANNGRYMKPFLVKDILDDGKSVGSYGPKVVKESIANPVAIDAMQELLREAVVNGTGKNFQSEDFEFSGKTGTARDYGGQHEKKEYNASFAGYFPSDNPKYSIIIMVYNPQESYYGSTVAGPVFRNVAEKIYALKYDHFGKEKSLAQSNKVKLPGGHSGYAQDFEKVFAHTGIDYRKKSGSWVKVDPSNNKMNIDKMKISKREVPDVSGMGLRDAIYILENLGLNVYAEGVGKVNKQSLRPGTQIKGQEISLYLN